MSASDRRALIDRDAPSPSIRRQCALLGVARSSVYRPPRPANDNDLALMRRIDELYAVSTKESRDVASRSQWNTSAMSAAIKPNAGDHRAQSHAEVIMVNVS